MRRSLVLTAAALLAAVPAALRAQSAGGREIRWVRDAEEYAVLTRQVYRLATRAAESAARQLPRGAAWAVVLDIDETTLDNSVYMLERAAYGAPFDTASWDAFLNRRESGVVPGVQDFVAAVRRLGGRVAWITDRDSAVLAATRDNLARFGLWNDADLLCPLRPAPNPKAVSRAEVAAGSGACSWSGQRTTIVAFVGDHVGDFPAPGEADPDAGRDAAFGVRYFLLPDPLYGSWERRPTRHW
jgi:acid phosphatase